MLSAEQRSLSELLHDELHWLDVHEPSSFQACCDGASVSEWLRSLSE